MSHSQGSRGYSRDKELEKDRARDEPADAELDSSEQKADRRPVIHYAPDPDQDAAREAEAKAREAEAKKREPS